MARPSRHLDERMVKAGLELAGEQGFTGLSVRQVARKAGVNPGLFHYHFKTKEEFSRRVLRAAYEDFFKRLHLEVGKTPEPLARLERALYFFARVARDNRRGLAALMNDSFQGYAPSADFFGGNMPKHMGVLGDLVKDCQSHGLLRPLPFPVPLHFLVSAVIHPSIVWGMMEGMVKGCFCGNLTPKDLERNVFSDHAILSRVHLALMGLGADPAGFSLKSVPARRAAKK